jgi:hypothetical protein
MVVRTLPVLAFAFLAVGDVQAEEPQPRVGDSIVVNFRGDNLREFLRREQSDRVATDNVHWSKFATITGRSGRDTMSVEFSHVSRANTSRLVTARLVVALSDIRPARSEQQISKSERRGVGVPHADSQTTIWQCDADKAKSLKLKTWEAVDD